MRHAITAGELLIEAKALVPHGQWLPWLKDHCSLSERSCQLYMRVAKGRTEIEANTQSIADSDLTLNEAAAILMLSSDVRKLLNFTKQADGLSGEALVEFCIGNNVGVITSPNYDPFAGRSEAEQQEWLVFGLFLSYDGTLGRAGLNPGHARQRLEYLLQRPFQNVDELLGPAGDEWCRYGNGGRNPTGEFKTAWAAFRDAHRHVTFADIEAKHEALRARFKEDKASGVIKQPDRRRRAGRGR